jgi:hypothetical protein
MMGHAVEACCCAAEHPQHRSRNATLRAADCCERLAASQQPVATSSHNAALPDLPVAALVALLPALTHPEPSYRLLPTLRSPARAPPALGPPLFISHCALLI